MKNLLGFTSLLISLILIVSCTNSNQQKGYFSDNAGNTVKVVPVYSPYGETSSFSVSYVFLDKNGELLIFDNDADYQSLCKISLYLAIMDFFVISSDGFEDAFGDSDKTVYLDSVESVINSVADYYNGNKDRITDANILEKLDRCYYDGHIDDREYHLSESGYNRKQYEAPGFSGYLTFGTLNEVWDWSRMKKWYFKDGSEVPQNALMIPTFSRFR